MYTASVPAISRASHARNGDDAGGAAAISAASELCPLPTAARCGGGGWSIHGGAGGCVIFSSRAPSARSLCRQRCERRWASGGPADVGTGGRAATARLRRGRPPHARLRRRLNCASRTSRSGQRVQQRARIRAGPSQAGTTGPLGSAWPAAAGPPPPARRRTHPRARHTCRAAPPVRTTRGRGGEGGGEGGGLLGSAETEGWSP